MHELLLFASLPASQHHHILSILAGIAAMQPLPLNEYHLVFKPTRKPGSIPLSLLGRLPQGQKAGAGGVGGAPGSGGPGPGQTSTDLFYMQLVGDLSRSRSGIDGEGDGGADGADVFAVNGGSGFGTTGSSFTGGLGVSGASLGATDAMDLDGTADTMSTPEASKNGVSAAKIGDSAATSAAPTSQDGKGAATIDWSLNPWTLEFRDLPDVPGKRPATTRLMSSIPITGGSPRAFVEGLGYVFASAHLLTGHTLTHNSVEIKVFRTYPVPTLPPQSGPSQVTPPTIPPPPADTSTLQPLDPSGGYLLQAAVRITDGNKPELVGRGLLALGELRDLLKSVLDLEVGDRLGLDTRVRG